MGTYRKEWDCCGSATETEAWEPDTCPFCTPVEQAQRAAAANAGFQAGREPYRALLAALDAHLDANDYGGLEVGKHHSSDVTRAIEAARAALSAPPVAWMNPDESFVVDAFIWSRDPQNPRYRVPVYDDRALSANAGTPAEQPAPATAAPSQVKTWQERMTEDRYRQPISAYCRAALADLTSPLDELQVMDCWRLSGQNWRKFASDIARRAIHANRAALARAESRAVPDIGAWISVDERKPDESLIRFLVTGRAVNGGPLGVHMAVLDSGRMYFEAGMHAGGCNPCIDDVVTHWMPPPLAPNSVDFAAQGTQAERAQPAGETMDHDQLGKLGRHYENTK